MIRVKDSRLCRYLWSGLDLVNYDVLEIHPQNRRFTAIIMYDIRGDAQRYVD